MVNTYKCKRKSVYYGSKAETYNVRCDGGTADEGESIEMEVLADDNLVGTYGSGESVDVEGKKIEVHALCRIIAYTATKLS